MRQPHSSVLPISPPDEAHDPPPGPRRDRPNLTERVAGWSAAHRKTAVFGWLLLIAAIFMLGIFAHRMMPICPLGYILTIPPVPRNTTENMPGPGILMLYCLWSRARPEI